MKTEIIRASVDRFSTDPDAARITPAVSARSFDDRVELSAGSFNWYADLPPALGGANSAPSPTAYLLGALAGCAVAFIRDTLAPQLGLRVDDVHAVARCKSDLRGLLGMEGAPPELGDIALDITVMSPEPKEQLDALYRVWLERCPIYLAVLRPNAIEAKFAVARSAADGAR